MNIPKVKDCIAYIEEGGVWKFSHRCLIGTYVFYRTGPKDVLFPSEVSFSLTEIRHAYKYGW